MLLELFALLVGIAIILIILGFTSDTMVFSTIGFFFLFLLSFNLINNELQRDGTVTITEINDSVTTVEKTISVYPDSTKTMGIYLAIGSSAGLILSFLSKTKIFMRR